MFFKQVNKKDSGITIFSNFFLDIFMPMANGVYVKVYLLGYRYACDPNSSPNFNNYSLARNLNLPLADVVAAWKYWEDQKLVIIHQSDSDDKFDFSIEFVDVMNFYRENVKNDSTSTKSDMDKILESRENPSIVKMFNSINKIIGRSLAPNESLRVLELIQELNLTPDLVVFAYEYCKEKNNGNAKPVRYVESVLRNWYDENIITVDDVKNSFLARSNRYALYNKVIGELGFVNRQATGPEKEMIDSWINDYNMSEEMIMYACSKSINTPNPNINYINRIIENWHKEDITSIEDAKKAEEEFRKEQEKKVNEIKNQKSQYKPPANKNNSTSNTKNAVKTRYHNTFNEHFRKYTPEELERKLLKAQKAKLKNKK